MTFGRHSAAATSTGRLAPPLLPVTPAKADGDRRGPRVRRRDGGTMDPGFRRDDELRAFGARDHARARLRPKMPRGRTSRVRIRMAKPTAGFQRGLTNSVAHSCDSPMTMPPASAP